MWRSVSSAWNCAAQPWRTPRWFLSAAPFNPIIIIIIIIAVRVSQELVCITFVYVCVFTCLPEAAHAAVDVHVRRLAEGLGFGWIRGGWGVVSSF